MADLITVRSGRKDNRVVLWERHPAHPNGEVLIKGAGDYRVAHTREVDRRLKHGGLVRVAEGSEPEPDNSEPEGDKMPDGGETQPTVTELPADFPGRDALVAGGYTSLEAVAAATDEALDAVPDIGPATIKAIREALQ